MCAGVYVCLCIECAPVHLSSGVARILPGLPGGGV